MPPRPLHSFHVSGEVLVGNPGVEAFLTVKEPQGINGNILLLDLHKFQRPGLWPQHTTWVQVRYDKILGPNNPKYTDVEIFENGSSIVRIKVEIVS
jgi:hypothetical protein